MTPAERWRRAMAARAGLVAGMSSAVQALGDCYDLDQGRVEWVEWIAEVDAIRAAAERRFAVVMDDAIRGTVHGDG
jgi:hypothetical protein